MDQIISGMFRTRQLTGVKNDTQLESTNMRILGIDPGLNTTGYGVLDFTARTPKLIEAGVVRGKTGAELPDRVKEIHDGVTDIIATLKPEVMAIEELYSHYDRPTTAILMGHARGAIILAAAPSRHPRRELPRHANQKDNHRQRPRRKMANARSHPQRTEPTHRPRTARRRRRPRHRPLPWLS